jgi:hypothetical protein
MHQLTHGISDYRSAHICQCFATCAAGQNYYITGKYRFYRNIVKNKKHKKAAKIDAMQGADELTTEPYWQVR